MKKGRVLSLKKFGISNYFSKDILYSISIILMVIGLFLGIVLFSKGNNITHIVEKIAKYYISLKKNDTIIKNFIITFLSSIIIYFILFSAGLSIIGMAFIPIIITLCGFFCGTFISLNYYLFSLKGIAFNAIMILPVLIIFSLFLIKNSKFCFEFSLSIANIMFKNDKASGLIKNSSIIGKKLAFIFLESLLLAIIDSVLGHYLIKIFDF